MRRLRNSPGERGQTLVLFVLCLGILIGMSALVIDVGSWYLTKRNAQSAADSSASRAYLSQRGSFLPTFS